MKLKEAYDILKRHNNWRRDTKSQMPAFMQRPEDIGVAIDTFLNYINSKKEEFEFNKKNDSEYFYEASGFYLNQKLNSEEFDKIAWSGECFDVKKKYENDSADYIEDSILNLADYLKTLYL